MKNKNLKSTLAVLIVILILIFLVCIEINTNKEYGNIGIDNSKLNIFFFNVGQAESILITNNNKKLKHYICHIVHMKENNFIYN